MNYVTNNHHSSLILIQQYLLFKENNKIRKKAIHLSVQLNRVL